MTGKTRTSTYQRPYYIGVEEGENRWAKGKQIDTALSVDTTTIYKNGVIRVVKTVYNYNPRLSK